MRTQGKDEKEGVKGPRGECRDNSPSPLILRGGKAKLGGVNPGECKRSSLESSDPRTLEPFYYKGGGGLANKIRRLASERNALRRSDATDFLW
jgi:hypothetical protein